MKLRYGPYSAPPIPVGGFLACDIYGLSEVADWTDAIIQWPRRKPPRHGGKRTLIICGDLRRALECEAAPAIAEHFGVSEPAIVRWRRQLKLVGAYPEGAREELRESLRRTAERIPDMLTHGPKRRKIPEARLQPMP